MDVVKKRRQIKQKQFLIRQTEETEEKEQERTQYPVSEADTETIYADREKNQELADFLIAYYQIPEEFCTETRYYYDRVDLNEDGTEEILAVDKGISSFGQSLR